MHKAVESGHLALVNTVFIDEIGFDTDFYTPDARCTLIHTLIRARGTIPLDNDVEMRVAIVDLVTRCTNLSLRDNKGQTILQLVVSTIKSPKGCNSTYLDGNIAFYSEVVTMAMFNKWKSVCFLFDKLNE